MHSTVWTPSDALLPCLCRRFERIHNLNGDIDNHCRVKGVGLKHRLGLERMSQYDFGF